MNRIPLTLRAMEDRALAGDRGASWHDRWSAATADATWQELGRAHDDAHSLMVSAAMAIADRLAVLGADRTGLGGRFPEVRADSAWCLSTARDKPRVLYAYSHEASNDPEDWHVEDIDAEEPEARRVQVLDGVTLVRTTGLGFLVLSSALRLDAVPDCLREFA